MPDLVPKYPLVTQATTADGLKITLSGIGNGLTVNKQGRPLLPEPFVFQCPPLEQYQITHAQNFGTYDTIDDDQFNRRGSRQLATWTFDTLAMYLGVDVAFHHAPSWVPHPTNEPGSAQYRRPEWYRDQLKALHDAASPFSYVAAFSGGLAIHSTPAVLMGFSEVYKHGEGDAIYFAGVSFAEWRDPGGATAQPRGHTKLPAHVRFRVSGGHYVAYEANTGHAVPSRADTTLSDLAHWFYGDPSKWRPIASANHLTGGSGSSPIFTHWYSRRLPGGFAVTMVIPKAP